MGTVTISGTAYEIYGTASGAKSYHAGTARGAAWGAASALAQNQALVEASRSFNRTKWVGVMTDPGTPQPLAWPRSGVTNCFTGLAVPDNVTPQEIEDGSYEWALQILSQADVVESDPSAQGGIKRTKLAEKVDVIETETETEWFAPGSGRTASRSSQPFDPYTLDLVACFLDSTAAAAAVTPFVSGAGAPSNFESPVYPSDFVGRGLDGGNS